MVTLLGGGSLIVFLESNLTVYFVLSACYLSYLDFLSTHLFSFYSLILKILYIFSLASPLFCVTANDVRIQVIVIQKMKFIQLNFFDLFVKEKKIVLLTVQHSKLLFFDFLL